MKTISMACYRRPDYERQVLDSLEPQLRGSQYQFFRCFDEPPPHNIGCDANTLRAIERAFNAGSDFNLHIEDDTVLAPDALALCDWFYTNPERDNYALISLHAHSREADRPLDIIESPVFSAWGWAITRDNWLNVIRPEWNQKNKMLPIGWDWSVSLTIQRHGLKTLHPILSRVRNIGRDNGTYETPSHWDKWAKDLIISPGGFGNDFRITDRLDILPPVEQWVTDEIEACRA